MSNSVDLISDQDMNEYFEQIHEIDFDQERAFLKQEAKLNQSDVDYLESLYIRWLILNKIHLGLQLIPNAEIDIFWHAHIINKSKYEKDCISLFGRNLDHKDMGKADLSEAFGFTKSLWTRYFSEELREPHACCSV